MRLRSLNITTGIIATTAAEGFLAPSLAVTIIAVTRAYSVAEGTGMIVGAILTVEITVITGTPDTIDTVRAGTTVVGSSRSDL